MKRLFIALVAFNLVAMQINWVDWAARALLQLARFAKAADIDAARVVGSESPFAGAMWQGISYVLAIPDNTTPFPTVTLVPTLYPTLSPVPLTPATIAPDVCIASPVSEVNLRTGPGTNFASGGTLRPLTRIEVVARAQSSTGFRWYQTVEGLWVREDVVSLIGACAALPTQ